MSFLLKTCSSLAAIAALIFVNRLYALYSNYTSALSLNIPVVICLESWQDPLWMLLGPRIRSALSCIGLWDRYATDYTTIGWSQFDRFASHAKYGSAFALVSPFKTNIMVSDVGAAKELLKNYRLWIKNQDLYGMFNTYGKNVNSVNGDDWQRHRKVTAPAFKEANSKLVWEATLKQVDSSIQKWQAEDEITLRGLRDDTEKIAMHVLMSASFSK